MTVFPTGNRISSLLPPLQLSVYPSSSASIFSSDCEKNSTKPLEQSRKLHKNPGGILDKVAIYRDGNPNTDISPLCLGYLLDFYVAS
jgi:hypothetical protein